MAATAPPLVITAADVREELSGSGMDRHLSRLATDIADQNTIIEKAIREEQAHLENDVELRIFLTRRVIKSRPADTGLERGTEYDYLDDAYDWIKDDFEGFGTFLLRRRPVQSVERVRIKYGHGSDAVNVIDMPSAWLEYDSEMGVLNIVPLVGMTTEQAGALLLLPVFGTGLRNFPTIPKIVHIDYTAGFLPSDWVVTDEGADPMIDSPDHDVTELLKCVRYLATVDMLRKVQRAVSAGGGSISLDGLSRSQNTAKFKQELDDYEAKIKEIKANYVSAYNPPNIFMV